MLYFQTLLLQLYLPLVGLTCLGWGLGLILPKAAPRWLGQFLFWVGVPLSVFAFLRHTELSGAIGIAPLVAWGAMLAGLGVAWIGLSRRSIGSPALQGSFLLAAMVGNTGYLGYPIVLALVGPKYFAWALFYDLLGTLPGAYGLGVVLASRYGGQSSQPRQMLQAVVQNPTLAGFGLGIACRSLALPVGVEQGLQIFAWGAIALSLFLIGMRLSQVDSWGKVRPALGSLGIKMVLIPLVLGVGLSLLGFTGAIRQILVLEAAMPPAFATLVLAETYCLDQSFTVTTLTLGTVGLLLLLPLWLWLFPA